MTQYEKKKIKSLSILLTQKSKVDSLEEKTG